MADLYVKFIYDASILGHRKRNPVDRKYLAEVPVEVREVTGRDAPVAMRFTADDYYDEAPGQELELRWEGGKLWRPAFKVEGNARRDENAVVTRREMDWLTTWAEEGHAGFGHGDQREPFPTGHRWSHTEPPVKPIEQDGEVSKVVKSTKDARMAEIRAAAEKILIVDGVPHVVSPEPVYSANYGYGRDSSPYAGVGFPESQKGSIGIDRIFRADELDWMMESTRVDPVPDDKRIEVLIPEAVRYDGPGQSVIQATEAMLQWMKTRVADRDVDFFVAYAALRDGLATELGRRAKSDAPDPDALDVAELARAAMQAVEGEEDFYRQRVEKALARIDARALSADIAFAP